MKIQVNTTFGIIGDKNIANQIFNENISLRTDDLDTFAFEVSNLTIKEINYDSAQAGPLSIKTLLGISDFTKVVSINVFLRQLNTDDTCETQPLQFNYSITTGAGDVALGKVSQFQLTGLSSSLLTDIKISTIPVNTDQISILSIVATISS